MFPDYLVFQAFVWETWQYHLEFVHHEGHGSTTLTTDYEHEVVAAQHAAP